MTVRTQVERPIVTRSRHGDDGSSVAFIDSTLVNVALPGVPIFNGLPGRSRSRCSNGNPRKSLIPS